MARLGELQVEGAAGVASVRRHQKLPLCLTEPKSAGSNTDLVLAKAKPISDGGSTSGTTNLKKGGRSWATPTRSEE